MAKGNMKPGGGGRFKAVEEAAAKSGARNPAAVAAAAGRKKYGAKQMAEMSGRGRSRAAAERKGEKEPPLHKVKPIEGGGLAEGLKAASEMKSKKL